MQDFIITQKNNIWWGLFHSLVDEALVGAGATALADTIKDTDALVTNLVNVPLLLFFADCVPLLFADERQGVCAVAHAGWRGTVAQSGR